MGFFFLASIFGLFPRLTVPIGVGWKEVNAFDLAFIACIAFAVRKGAFRSFDRRLIAAGAAFVASTAPALWAHPSPEGVRSLISLGYSVTVLLAVAHLQVDALKVQVDRAILGPLLVAIGFAAVVFLTENMFGVTIANNQSPMLPAPIHRLGGFTGGNALILFIAIAAPLCRAPWLVLGGIVAPAIATFSRSLLGLGVALILNGRGLVAAQSPARRAIQVVAWLSVAVSLFIYAFAVIPVSASERATHLLSFSPGGYLTPHLAALRMIESSPLIGVGPAQFVEQFRDFTSEPERAWLPEANRRRCDPHSALLGLAAEQGLLSLAAFAWLLREIYRRLGGARDPQFRTAAVAGLTGLLAGGHFVDWLALKGLWFWIGLLVAASRASSASRPAAPRPETDGRGSGTGPG
jgi:hypothetical protein